MDSDGEIAKLAKEWGLELDDLRLLPAVMTFMQTGLLSQMEEICEIYRLERRVVYNVFVQGLERGFLGEEDE